MRGDVECVLLRRGGREREREERVCESFGKAGGELYIKILHRVT